MVQKAICITCALKLHPDFKNITVIRKVTIKIAQCDVCKQKTAILDAQNWHKGVKN